jgi:pteridine reductase
LVAVTRGLALELAPEVRVNAIAPGPILWAASEDAELQATTLASTPLARRGDPQDIAQAVCYLARATFVTGHILDVDGGRSLVS